jgi:hypothetical protein
VYKLLNEFKDDTNKQLDKFKDNSNKQQSEWNKEDKAGYERGIQQRQNSWKK